MFHYTGDPYQSLTTSLCIWYTHNPFELSSFKSPNYISPFILFLQELRDQNAANLSNYENIQKLIVEVFPYAFLLELSWHRYLGSRRRQKQRILVKQLQHVHSVRTSRLNGLTQNPYISTDQIFYQNYLFMLKIFCLSLSGGLSYQRTPKLKQKENSKIPLNLD